jgi:type IV secretion system protein VirB10
MRLFQAILPVVFVGGSLAGQTALSQAPSPASSEPSAQASTQPAAQSTTPVRPTYTVPIGTKVLLQLNSAINSKSAKPGDGVYLTSIFPVVVGNRVMIPSGVYVQGVIDNVIRGGRIKGKAQLDMHFTSIIFPNGSVVEIPGMVNSLPGASHQSVKNDGEGTIEQSGDKGRNAGETAKVAIPTGAGVGTIAGAVGGHPIEGGLAGLGAGLATVGIVSLFTRNADVEIPSGTQVEMLLQQPLKLQESNVAGSAATNVTLVPAADQPKPLPKPVPQQMVCATGSFGCQ